VNLPVIILGSGGHAKVIMDALSLQSVSVLGMTDSDQGRWNKSVMGVTVLGDDDAVLQHSPRSIRLIIGIGSVSKSGILRRKQLYEKFKSRGYSFASVVHPSAVVSRDASLEEGVQLMAGTVVQTGARIKANSIVNTRVSVDHDCDVGVHCHLAPGVILSGGVQVGDEVHIGTGAVVIHNIKIGRGSIVGAGATVLTDVRAGVSVAGIPAREINS
jgi:UDP-perosamine 4-acetyltransferase